jgi:zinc transport system substrate-binding protein
MRTVLILTIASLALALAAAGCGGSGDAAGDSPGASADGSAETIAAGQQLDVVAGFYPLAYATEVIGGDSVSVENLTPPGVEPHDLELSARDVERVQAAGLVLYLGESFQPALEDAATGASGQAVDLLEGLELREGAGGEEGDEHEGDEHEGEELGADPHVWLDPTLYASIAERIGELLGRQEQAAELAAELAGLDQELAAGLADCERRVLVTSHAAFGYLAARYGLEQLSVTGLSPEAEPSPSDLENVVAAVRESGATTVFAETLVSPELAETVAREAGAEIAVLNPLEGLTEEEQEAGADYFSVMRDNLAALRSGLGCR